VLPCSLAAKTELCASGFSLLVEPFSSDRFKLRHLLVSPAIAATSQLLPHHHVKQIKNFSRNTDRNIKMSEGRAKPANPVVAEAHDVDTFHGTLSTWLTLYPATNITAVPKAFFE